MLQVRAPRTRPWSMPCGARRAPRGGPLSPRIAPPAARDPTRGPAPPLLAADDTGRTSGRRRRVNSKGLFCWGGAPKRGAKSGAGADRRCAPQWASGAKFWTDHGTGAAPGRYWCHEFTNVVPTRTKLVSMHLQSGTNARLVQGPWSTGAVPMQWQDACNFDPATHIGAKSTLSRLHAAPTRSKSFPSARLVCLQGVLCDDLVVKRVAKRGLSREAPILMPPFLLSSTSPLTPAPRHVRPNPTKERSLRSTRKWRSESDPNRGHTGPRWPAQGGLVTAPLHQIAGGRGLSEGCRKGGRQDLSFIRTQHEAPHKRRSKKL